MSKNMGLKTEGLVLTPSHSHVTVEQVRTVALAATVHAYASSK